MGLLGFNFDYRFFKSIVNATVLSTHRNLLSENSHQKGSVKFFYDFYPLRTGTNCNPCENCPWTEVLIEGSFANQLTMRLTESEVVKQ